LNHQNNYGNPGMMSNVAKSFDILESFNNQFEHPVIII